MNHSLETAATDPGAEMQLVPFRLRPTSPEFLAVWQALYGLAPGAVTKERAHVPYADALMFPLSNEEVRKARPDLIPSYVSLERLLKTHLADLGLSRLPLRLKGCLSEVVTPSVA